MIQFLLFLCFVSSNAFTLDVGFRQSNQPHVRSSGGISGNVDNMGYFYTTVRFGDQEFGVIIDTGSHRTVVPCNTCSRCGHHLHSRYSYKHIVHCKDPECSQHCYGDKCSFSISYLEGSKLSGFSVKDSFYLGNNLVNENYVFGCANVMTNMFRSQQADGILGLNKQALRYITPHNKKVSINLSKHILTIGEDFQHRMQFFVPLLHSDNYFATLQQVQYGSNSMNVKERVLFDSGSTYSYVTSSFFSNVKRLIERQCHCKLHIYRSTLCFPKHIKKLPFHFIFNGHPMIISPSSYTYHTSCIEMVRDRAPITLGMNFMRSLDIGFSEHQIGWNNLT